MQYEVNRAERSSVEEAKTAVEMIDGQMPERWIDTGENHIGVFLKLQDGIEKIDAGNARITYVCGYSDRFKVTTVNNFIFDRRINAGIVISERFRYVFAILMSVKQPGFIAYVFLFPRYQVAGEYSLKLSHSEIGLIFRFYGSIHIASLY
jgi:hypothetical protein